MLDILWWIAGIVIATGYFIMAVLYFQMIWRSHSIGDTYQRDWSIFWLAVNIFGFFGMLFVLTHSGA